jgi:hypothetical protein
MINKTEESFDHLLSLEQNEDNDALKRLRRRFQNLVALRDEIANVAKEHSQKINTNKEGAPEQLLADIAAHQEWTTLKLVEVVEKLELITWSVFDLFSWHADEIDALNDAREEDNRQAQRALRKTRLLLMPTDGKAH